MVTRRSIHGESSTGVTHRPLSLPANDLRIIAVLPALNQAEDISTLISKLKYHADEVVVVDDGSNDETAKLAEAAGACVLKHEMELGKQEALVTGIRAAQALGADLIIMHAADGGALPSSADQVVAANQNAQE